MKRILIFASLFFSGLAVAQNHTPIQYAVPATVEFRLYNADGTLDVDEVDGGSEVTVHCNQDAGATATNDFVDEGSFYSIALTAAETDCAMVTLDINATVRSVLHIPTFGDINAFDKTQGIASGEAQSATASTVVLASATSLADDIPNNAVVCITAGTGAGQCRVISDWVSTTDTATVSQNWVTNPASGSDYIVKPANQSTIAEFSTQVASDTVAAWIAEACPGSPTTDSLADRLCAYIATIQTDTTTDIPTLIGTPNVDLATDIADIPDARLIKTTIATLASQISFTLTAGSSDDDAYDGAMIVVTDQTTSTQKSVSYIKDYIGASRSVTLWIDPGIFTIAVGDTVEVYAWNPRLWEAHGQVLVDTTIASLTSQTVFTLTDGSAYDDSYNDAVAVMFDSNLQDREFGVVSDYVGSTKQVTLEYDPGSLPYGVGDRIQIIAAGGIADSGIKAASLQADTVTAAKVATDAIGASELAADAVDEVWDEILEDMGSTYTGRCIMAAMLAYAAGDVTTTGGVSTYRDPGNNENRIVGTVSGSSRGSITITCP